MYIYICNYENNVPSRLSPQWLCGNFGFVFMIIYIYIYIYAIMKTMCPPGYHHNGFVTTLALFS